jgi:dipeptidyl aminopeptidase/acylaminoacyl peptidase
MVQKEGDMTTIAPYGSWKSPVTPDLIVAGGIGLSQVALDGEDIYWVEQRPSEGGRNVVVKRTPDGVTADVTPAPFNARTRVHEYGGGAYAVADGVVYFFNFLDQRLYRQRPGAAPEPITPAIALRYADGVMDRCRNRMICVREDHRLSDQAAVNTLVSVKLDGDSAGGQVLVAGNDFYSSPRLSPDESRLAWLTWNHPNMPWDGTELWVGELNADGSLGRIERAAGGANESIGLPQWSPEGVLHFVSDRTGWWNLYRWRTGRVEPLCDKAAEFGLPQWVFGQSLYGFDADRIICAYGERGAWHLASLDAATGRLDPIDLPYQDVWRAHVGGGQAVLGVGSPTEPASIIRLDLATRQVEVLKRSSEAQVDPAYLSIPQAIEFPTENGLTAHGFFYAPRNPDYAAPPGELPPLVVISHGGPTGSTSMTLNLNIQYWTSRGFAVLDVNYGGSTGYGREYRRRLNGQWGVVDVDDCVNGARYLVEQKLVDGERLVIRGGSAGGYTTLCALTFRDVFKAGADYFGVSDLEVLDKNTHKFESRYNYSLIGPYPERRDVYVSRSPVHFADRIVCPVIFFQGLEDQIVPPEQSEIMYRAVRDNGLPTAYLAFEGEQHGFRRAETIKRTLEAELYFYGQVFGFELADAVEPVKIDNLNV